MSSEITSIADIVKYAEGKIVKLPDFAPGQPFVARMRRPSLLALAKNGRIPNPLLKSVTALFEGDGQVVVKDEKTLADIYDLCNIFAEAALIEPSFEDIKTAGLQFNDEQLMFIFKYSQAGNEAAENFRNE